MLQGFDHHYHDRNDPLVLGYSKEYQMAAAASPMAPFSKSHVKKLLQANSKTDIRSLSPAAKKQHIKELLRMKPHLTHLLKKHTKILEKIITQKNFLWMKYPKKKLPANIVAGRLKKMD